MSAHELALQKALIAHLKAITAIQALLGGARADLGRHTEGRGISAFADRAL